MTQKIFKIKYCEKLNEFSAKVSCPVRIKLLEIEDNYDIVHIACNEEYIDASMSFYLKIPVLNKYNVDNSKFFLNQLCEKKLNYSIDYTETNNKLICYYFENNKMGNIFKYANKKVGEKVNDFEITFALNNLLEDLKLDCGMVLLDLEGKKIKNIKIFREQKYFNNEALEKEMTEKKTQLIDYMVKKYKEKIEKPEYKAKNLESKINPINDPFYLDNLSDGVSFIIRAKNEEQNTEACLLGLVKCLTDKDEIIFVDNKSADNTYNIASRLAKKYPIIKVFKYDCHIPIQGTLHLMNVSTGNTLSKFYNWCLCKCTKNYAIKWDTDFIPVIDNVKEMIEKFELRTRKSNCVIWFSGTTIFTKNRLFYSYNHKYNEHRVFSYKHGFRWYNNNPPINETSDPWIHYNVPAELWFKYEKPIFYEMKYVPSFQLSNFMFLNGNPILSECYSKISDINRSLCYNKIHDEIKLVKDFRTDVYDKIMEKKRVVLVYDMDGWAFDNICLAVMNNNNGNYDIKKMKIDEFRDNCNSDRQYLEKNFDIVVFTFYADLWGIQIHEIKKKESNFKVIVCVYDTILWLEQDIFKKRLAYAIENSDAILYSSNKLKETLAEHFGDKILYGPCKDGVSTEIFPNIKKYDDIMTKKKIVVGMAGNFSLNYSSNKGYAFLKDAVEKCSDIVELKVQSKDEYIPHNQMKNFYSSIDVYVCMSKMEGTPNPILESSSCGVCWISTDVGIVPEMCQDESLKPGIILNERSVDALAEQFRFLHKNRHLIKEYGANGAKVIRKSWDLAITTNQFYSMFDKITKGYKYQYYQILNDKFLNGSVSKTKYSLSTIEYTININNKKYTYLHLNDDELFEEEYKKNTVLYRNEVTNTLLCEYKSSQYDSVDWEKYKGLQDKITFSICLLKTNEKRKKNVYENVVPLFHKLGIRYRIVDSVNGYSPDSIYQVIRNLGLTVEQHKEIRKGAMGIMMTMMGIWEDIIHDPNYADRYNIILEDDMNFDQTVNLLDIIKKLDDKQTKFDLFYFYLNPVELTHTGIEANIVNGLRNWGGCAYMVSREGAKNLRKHLTHIDNCWDDLVMEAVDKDRLITKGYAGLCPFINQGLVVNPHSVYACLNDNNTLGTSIYYSGNWDISMFDRDIAFKTMVNPKKTKPVDHTRFNLKFTDTTVSATMANIPLRTKHLPEVINSIRNQVDYLFVYCNYKKEEEHLIPKCLNEPWIIVFKAWEEVGDLFCDGKYYPIQYIQDGYVFGIDDDIVYPENYFQIGVDGLERYDRKIFVSYHGGIVSNDKSVNFCETRNIYHFNDKVSEDVKVNICGSGASAWHVKNVKISYLECLTHNITDCYLALMLQKQKIPIINIKKEGGDFISREYPKSLWKFRFIYKEVENDVIQNWNWVELDFPKLVDNPRKVTIPNKNRAPIWTPPKEEEKKS